MRKFAVILLLPMLTGCRHKVGPNNFPLPVDHAELITLRNRIDTYRDKGCDMPQRNALQMRLKTVSDAHYRAMRNRLSGGMSTINLVGEMTSTTLSAVSALVGDVDTKSILSTASTLTQAGKVSVDKNYFQEQSTAALVAKMDALRATSYQTILAHQADSINEYGLERALNDSLAYDDAGTLQAAITQIQATAAADKVKAEAATQADAKQSPQTLKDSTNDAPK